MEKRTLKSCGSGLPAKSARRVAGTEPIETINHPAEYEFNLAPEATCRAGIHRAVGNDRHAR